MSAVEQRVANEICLGFSTLDSRKWLAEEASDLAVRFPGLVAVSIECVLLLVWLSANGPMNELDLARSAELDPRSTEAWLEQLCEYSFARTCIEGFEATRRGQDVFRALARKMILRGLFELNRQHAHLTRLNEQINAAWSSNATNSGS